MCRLSTTRPSAEGRVVLAYHLRTDLRERISKVQVRQPACHSNIWHSFCTIHTWNDENRGASQRQMKILYALDSYRPNIDGVGISTERQALGLAHKGHDVAIIAPSQRFVDYEETDSEIKVYRVRSVRIILGRWRLALLSTKRAEEFIDDFSPDVIVISLPFPLNWSALNAGRNRGVPTVGITGTMPEWLIYNLGFLRPFSKTLRSHLWRALATFYNRCDTVVAVTATAMGLLQEHGLDRPVHIISNGVNLKQFKPRRRNEQLAQMFGVPNKPTVLYTGRLDSEKCMDVWIRAIPAVLREMDVHFVIVGEGSEYDRLVALANRLGIESHVTFAGFLSSADYCQVFSIANVFAISSPAELQSIVSLEAAASGLPLVAVKAGALPELVHDGRNGYLFEEGNSADMAKKLLSILRRPADLQHMGRESRLIAHRHNLERSIAQYEDLYTGLVRQ
ncbi:MAG: glycosyltransferase [Chloroflexi bacterium]|nr:glycosyltransferase [Chloroflexota bacterium]